MQGFKRTMVLFSMLVAGNASAITVPGSANPNLAGRGATYTCCSGDSVLLHAPVSVGGVNLSACAALEFSVTGAVSFTPSPPTGNNPDGNQIFSMTNYGDGISAPLNVPVDALMGVFLSEDDPTGSPTPDTLDFHENLGFASLAAGVGQIFFIGDGRTTDTSAGVFNGPHQTFLVPPGATRLFLGTSDGTGWFNNTGSFDVVVTSTPSEFECGDAAPSSAGVATNDALAVLRAAVGSALCLECICDADGSGEIAATDALRVLRVAVGEDVTLLCPCCSTV